MRRCWRIDPGALGAADLVIEIRVRLRPNGTLLATPDILDTIRYNTDGYFRSAADSARRAIQECSPFTLPQSRYDLWKDMKLRFDPRRMFGG